MRIKRVLLFMIVLFVLNIAVVKADSAACAGEIENSQNSVGIGDTFIYSIGTMGASSNTKIFDLNFYVMYEDEYINLVGDRELDITPAKGWKVTYDTVSKNAIEIHAYTDDPAAMYINVPLTTFKEVVRIRFKVISKSSTSSSISIKGSSSRYLAYVDGGESGNSFSCGSNNITSTFGIYTKNNNDKLSELKINHGSLSPKFSANKTEYAVTVENDIDNITVSAKCPGLNCTVSGIGTHNLEVGENTIVITVTSEAGTRKEYKIIVTREEKKETYLITLRVRGGTISPEFQSDIHEYTVTVPYETDALDLIFTSNNEEDNKVSTTGNSNLQVGENKVTVKVTNEKTGVEANYELNVIKEKESTKEEKEKNDDTTKAKKDNTIKLLIILIPVIFSIILLVVFLVVKRKHRSNQNIDIDN